MFDDEELEQLREGEDEWKGHVDRQKIRKSRTSRKVFLGSVTASMTLAVAMVALTVSSSMVVANLIGVAGIGGFNAEIEQINNAENIAIYPALGPTAACNSDVDFNQGPDNDLPNNGVALPQLRAEIGGLDIPAGQALTLTKDINLPDTFLSDLQTFRVRVAQESNQGQVNINNAVLYLTGLKADRIEINQAQIREFFSNTPDQSFYEGGDGLAVTNDSIAGDVNGPASTRPGEFAIQNRPGTTANASITNAEARAHFVAFDKLDIENISLETQYGTVANPLPNVTSINHSRDCPTGTLPANEGTDGPTGSS